MTQAETVEAAPARSYARLLLRLHALIAMGQGDSEEADAIRDRLDAPWDGLMEAEQDRLGGLSEDLYQLADHGPGTAAIAPEQRQAWGQAFGAAFQKEDWDRTLALLRRAPAGVPADHVAFLQADCWERLGYLEVALRFRRAGTPLNTNGAFSMLTLPGPPRPAPGNAATR
jgi:hypothetical protein